MANSRFLAGLLVLVLTAGCKAQPPANAQNDAAMNRRIEVLVRSRYELPADVTLVIGARQPSQFTGYETLPIIMTRGGKSQQISFLISADGSKLIHLDTLDLSHDPAEEIPLAGRPIRGNPNAKVTVVSFDDLECPFCSRMHQELFPETYNRYKDLVRYVYKDYPLVEIHPWAMHAAVDANCLAEQNSAAYWQYVDYLHAHGEEVSGPDRDVKKSYTALDRIAREQAAAAKLDQSAVEACLAKQDETQINASVKLATSLGIDGTPAIFVNGERVSGGAVPTDQLWMVIDRALRAEGEQPPPPAAAPAAAGHGGSQ